MTEGRRPQRVQKELQQLIAQYIQTEWKGPSPGLLTVVKVDVATDLRSAMVYISVIGTENDSMDIFEELIQEQRPQIQNFVSKNLRMKFYPRLNFKLGSYGELPQVSSNEDEG